MARLTTALSSKIHKTGELNKLIEAVSTKLIPRTCQVVKKAACKEPLKWRLSSCDTNNIDQKSSHEPHLVNKGEPKGCQNPYDANKRH